MLSKFHFIVLYENCVVGENVQRTKIQNNYYSASEVITKIMILNENQGSCYSILYSSEYHIHIFLDHDM